MSNSKKKNPILTILLIATPFILVALLVVYLIINNNYNKTERYATLTQDFLKDGVYEFGDVAVKISDRGGDSGSWLKDPIYDEDGNELHGASVGTIYEALIYNSCSDTISDWTLQVPINEMMWINNNWNSKMEIHQDVRGEHGGERVLAIDLSDYGDYDINLDYYIDHTGPMIPLYEGDYFIYLPEEIAEEKPIKPSPNTDAGLACARFGFITYIPDQTLDYLADFSGAKLTYYLYADPFTKVPFWVLIGLLFIWLITFIVSMLVQYSVNKVISEQQRMKEHDEMMLDQSMRLIVNMIETKDSLTHGHSIRVAEYSRMIAETLGYSVDECKKVYYIGLMHDCGKVQIPDSILKNPGKLTPEEYEIMKKHTIYGADVLRDFTSIPGIDIGAKYHHERYDGTGYPSGMAGEEIPLIARIIGIADAFDAMSSDRCYRDRLPSEVIIDELEKNRGKQFDPHLVDRFLKVIKSRNLLS